MILEIDDRTKDDAGNYPLSREYIADVIENITKIHPQKILFDGVLVADGQPEHDKRLALAIEKLGLEDEEELTISKGLLKKLTLISFILIQYKLSQ